MEEFKSFFKRVTGNEGERCHYSTRLDTYGCGCSHDCAYCYAKSLLDFRKLWNPSHPTSANVDAVVRTIRRKLHAGDVVRLGGMTDCFQGVEAERRITYRAIQELNRQRVHYLIVTKSDLVATDEYVAILDKELAHIQISITTTDDELCKTYEKAPSPTRRIRAVEKLYALGFDVAVRLSPYIPQYVDIDRINAIKCDKILVEFLRVNTWVRRWFDIDFSEYTLKNAGYEHLPLERKIQLLRAIDGFKYVSVCEDVPEHWEHWRTHYNSNPDDCCNLRLKHEKNNMVQIEVKRLKLADLVQNTGAQIEGLDINPRTWTKAQLDKLVKSIRETPELIEAGTLKVTPIDGGKYVILGGNMRFDALTKLGYEDVPCALFPQSLGIDKLREIVIKDNGSFGEWDWTELANKWNDMPLTEWGVSVWKTDDSSDTSGDDPEDGSVLERATEKISGLEYDPLYYQPKERPNIRLADCVDTRKFEAKVKALEEYDLTPEQRETLEVFAYRFLKIDFESVADYYAYNASEEEKKAMERLRLVLTDDGKNGFIEDDLLKVGKMTKTFSDLAL